MIYERFEMPLIVPFWFNPSFYKKIGIRGDAGGKQYFQRKVIRSNRLNEQNEDIWKDEEQGLVRCLELQPKHRKTLGLYAKESWTYRMENRYDIPFKISNVNGWFFKRGEGFLTLRVRADGLDEKHILDFCAILSDIKAEEKLCYILKTGRDQTDEMNFTVKDLIRNFFGVLGQIEVETQKRTFLQAMSLCYGIAEELDSETSGIHFENLRLNADRSSSISRKIDSSFLY